MAGTQRLLAIGCRPASEVHGGCLFGEAMLYLTDQSSVIVHSDATRMAKEFEAELVSGTVVLSAAGTAGKSLPVQLAFVPLVKREG